MRMEKEDSNGSLSDIKKFIGPPNPIINRDFIEPQMVCEVVVPPEDVDSS